MAAHDIRESSSLHYIQGLDGLRAIAVLWVISFHYLSYFAAPKNQPSLLHSLASVGWVGVDIFLVISGLLITKILMKSPPTMRNIGSFIRRRAVRLIPAYLLLLFAFTMTALAIDPSDKVLHNSWSLWTLTSNIQASFADRLGLGDGRFAMYHLWSIAIEWHYYLLFSALVFLSRSTRSIATAFIVVAISFRIAFSLLGISDNAIYAFTFCRMDAFAIGSLLALVPTNKLPKLRLAAGIVGLLVLAFILIAVAHSADPFKSIPWLQMGGYTAIDVSVAFIIWWVIYAGKNSLPLLFLETRALRSVGRASYSIYLWHLPFYPLIISQTERAFAGSHHVELISITFAATISAGLSFISYRFVEFPFMRSRKKTEGRLMDQSSTGAEKALPS